MKTLIPVAWEGTELPVPIRVTDEAALDLVKARTHVYCPKAFYKQFVLGKELGIQPEAVHAVIARRKN